MLNNARRKVFRPADTNLLSFRPLRDELELAVIQLRELRDDMPEEDYFERVQSLLVRLAEVYEEADRAAAESGSISQ